jgi:hypothetical protein
LFKPQAKTEKMLAALDERIRKLKTGMVHLESGRGQMITEAKAAGWGGWRLGRLPAIVYPTPSPASPGCKCGHRTFPAGYGHPVRLRHLAHGGVVSTWPFQLEVHTVTSPRCAAIGSKSRSS